MDLIEELKDYEDLAPGKTFRVNARKLFLTYSSTPKSLSPKAVITRLEKKASIKHYLISQERHPQPTKKHPWHIHAFLEFWEKINIVDAKKYDLYFHRENYHPHFKKVSTSKEGLERLYQYIKKDGEYITNLAQHRYTWEELVEANSREDFLKGVLREVPNPKYSVAFKCMDELWKINQGFHLKDEHPEAFEKVARSLRNRKPEGRLN